MNTYYLSIVLDAGEMVADKTDRQKKKSLNKITSVSCKNCEENNTGQCDNERLTGHR